jgi:DNA mismatch repair protein MutL
MPYIHRLPQHVIHHIAAGEAIEEPASLLKELIENSLDAGATRIEIDLVNAGHDRIKITDNGVGIHKKSLPLVFERYATSKLSQIEDFNQLQTFGFRGEALFSVCNVADVTLITRSQRDQEGSMIKTFRGTIEGIYPCGSRIGTTLIVDRMFSRFPVRREQLNAKKDLAAIKQLVQLYAFTYPEVTFHLSQNRQTITAFFDQEDTLRRVAKAWDLQPNQLFEIQHRDDHVQFKMYASLPEFFHTKPNRQQIFINNRPVIARGLKETVSAAFSTFRHAGKFPQFLLFIEIPPEYLDQNVHPQKKEVRMMMEAQIIEALYQALQEKIAELPVSAVRFSAANKLSDAAQEETPWSEPNNQITPLPELFQLQNQYIINLTDQGVLLIDQHAADEKLWYNRLLQDEELLDVISSDLNQECMDELDDDVYQHSFDDQINARIATIACHQAVRAGEELTTEKMQQLVQAILSGGSRTLTCPHGRPTHILINLSQLETMFRRR